MQYVITCDEDDQEYVEQLLRGMAAGCRENCHVDELKRLPTRRRKKPPGKPAEKRGAKGEES